MSGAASLTVHLDRPNGVYREGETVRGRVRLHTAREIKTRGVTVCYQGVSYMHFHAGSGKNRHDHFNFKTYDDHRSTVFGNSFNTAALEGAGSDARFGAAGGDGIINIPCHQHEPLSLILRVLHANKSVLGERVVDVNKLLSRSQPSTYHLTRNGQEEQSKIQVSAKMIPSAPFVFSGTTYNAMCHLQVHRAAGLRGAALVGWNDVTVQASRAPANLDTTQALPAPDANVVLPAGVIEFPFAFPIRADAPSSTDLGLRGRTNTGAVCEAAFIHYFIRATVDIPWWKDVVATRGITVVSSRPQATPALLRGIEYQCDAPMKLASCCCFPCFTGIGNITIDAKLMKQAFAANERLKFSMRICNNTKSKLTVHCSLQCTVILQDGSSLGAGKFKSTFHVDPHETSEIGSNPSSVYDINRVTAATIPTAEVAAVDVADPAATLADPGTTGGETEVAAATHATPAASLVGSNAASEGAVAASNISCTNIYLAVPNVQPSFNGASGLGKTDKEPIIWSYCVRFEAFTPGCFGTSKTVTLPVVICTAPPTGAVRNSARLANQPCKQQNAPKCNPFSLHYSRDVDP